MFDCSYIENILDDFHNDRHLLRTYNMKIFGITSEMDIRRFDRATRLGTTNELESWPTDSTRE